MLRFLKYSLVAFLAQVVFWAVLLSLVWNIGEKAVGGAFLLAVAFFYLWPLFLLPSTGGSHGGELFFAPFTIIFYSLVFGLVAVIWNKLVSRMS